MVHVHVWKVDWCPTYGKYVVVLKEPENERITPIIVHEWEAKTIEVLLNQKSQEPYKTARLFSYLIENLNTKIVRIEIQKKIYGEILARIIYCNQDKTFSMTHSPGEAIELAVRCRAPIMIPESLLFAVESKAQQSAETGNQLKQLKEKLEKVIAQENFEAAAKIRDKILKLEKKVKSK